MLKTIKNNSMKDNALVTGFKTTRQQSLQACEPLAIDDYGLQAEAFTSPPKWHLAHTSWFFETFLLKPFLPDYQPFCEQYEVLFNSYYNAVGEQFPRPKRGLLSRPTVDEVMHYREHVDQAMMQLLSMVDHSDYLQICQRCRLGIEHEQQHQELFYTDLKYSLAINPLYPSYMNGLPEKQLTESSVSEPAAMQWCEYQGGAVAIGVDEAPLSHENFSFDNESPRHTVFLQPFALANRLVTNAEFAAFIDDGGYQRPELWLADGWAVVQSENWQAPLYWRERDGQPVEFTLHGLLPRNPDQAVCHISGYEADAYASWAKARLPTEAEWEYAASSQANDHHEYMTLQPSPASGDQPLLQLYSDCWQWTGSAYRPYPGFSPAAGAIGEYNGKFMCNQWVLRGGSCVSQANHLRPSYRNFFYPQDRWQFSGIRLAKDL